MTTTSAFSFHRRNLSSLDDKMEMGSSPLRQTDDVEFDLDDPQGFFDEMNSDRMEDGANFLDSMQRDESKTNPDDEMFDDHQGVQHPDLDVKDLDMANNEPESVGDEDILYDDEEFLNTDELDEQPHGAEGDDKSVHAKGSDTGDAQPNNIDQTNNQNSELPTATTQDDSAARPTDTSTASETTHEVEEELEGDQEEVDRPAETDVVDFALEAERDGPNINGEIQKESETTQEERIPPENTTNDHSNDNTELGAEKNESVALDSEKEETSHLHSVKVTYFGQEMSLFPPREGDSSTTFFLEDSSLAYENFEKLLAACRMVLGESLGHDDEIVLDVPALGLHICEDSKYASQLTLAQVIDTYMLLSQNEQLSDIEPLHCQLSHRVCLASQVAYLASSAREGKTYTDIAADYLDTPESELEPEPVIESSAETEFDDNAAVQDKEDAYDHDEHESTDEVEEGDLLTGAGTAMEAEAELSQSQHPAAADHDAEHSGDVTNDTGIEAGDAQLPTDEPDQYDYDLVDPTSHASSHTIEADQVTSHEDVPTEAVPVNDEEYLAFTDDESQDEDNATPSHDAEIVTPTEATETDIGASVNDNGIPKPHEAEEQNLLESDFAEDTFNDQIEDLFETNENGNPNSETTAPPFTPSKPHNGKRRALDDDDDLEIDISTPEPKRSRAS